MTIKEVFESFETKREALAYIQSLKDFKESFEGRIDAQIKSYEDWLEFTDLT